MLYPNEIVLVIFALVGAIPLLIQLFNMLLSTLDDTGLLPLSLFSKQQPLRYKNVDQSAVLLPIIDSANHHADSMKDTNIVYNPLRHTFEWSIGPSSFVQCPNIIRPPLRRQTSTTSQTFDSVVPTTKITSNDLLPTSDSVLVQVCISYGKQTKSDVEWMINYGFLPGVEVTSDIDNFDQYRNFLSQQFLLRNP
jgi:hypothetical protein